MSALQAGGFGAACASVEGVNGTDGGIVRDWEDVGGMFEV